jgi:glutathione S-transferase
MILPSAGSISELSSTIVRSQCGGRVCARDEATVQFHRLRENAMPKIWGRPNSICTQRVLWACAEAGIAYDLILASGTMGPAGHLSQGCAPFGHVDTAAYREMNPNGTVPTLNDDDVVLWDSNAIVAYIASRYAPTLYGADPAGTARALQWMSWANEHLEPLLHILVMELVRLAPEKRDGHALEAARCKTIEKLEVLDRELGKRPFLTGDSFTMGDIPAGATVYRWSLFDLERPRLDNLEDWQKRLQDRDAFQEIVAPRENHLA